MPQISSQLAVRADPGLTTRPTQRAPSGEPAPSAERVERAPGELVYTLFGGPSWVTFESRAKEVVRENRFAVDRTLLDYRDMLSPEFEKHLAKLGRSDHILDAGAGNCAAMAGILRTQNSPSVTAISYYLAPWTKAWLSTFSRLNAVSGVYFEKIPKDAIVGRFGDLSMVTDVFGIFSYTTTPSEILTRYLNLLRDDGVIYLYLPTWTHSIHDTKDSKRTFQEWIESNQTIDAHVIPPGKKTCPVIVIRRKPNVEPAIPRLELLRMDASCVEPAPRHYFEASTVAIFEEKPGLKPFRLLDRSACWSPSP